MSKYIAIIFPDEVRAYEGTKVLKNLHRDGSIVLYTHSVVSKDDVGEISVKEAASTSGVSGSLIGAVAGGLVGLLAGPLGAVAGLAGGTLIGGFKDLFDAGITSDFVVRIADELTPGRSAIFAEIGEEWTTPLDTAISPLGGVIVRELRRDVEDETISREVEAARSELAHLREEAERAGDKAGDELKSRITEARTDLEQAIDRAKAKAESLRAEADARIDVLKTQAEELADEAGRRAEIRVARAREEYQRRTAKLEQAWTAAKDALRS